MDPPFVYALIIKDGFLKVYIIIINYKFIFNIYRLKFLFIDFLIRFIRAYDEDTSMVWIVPDFMEEGGIKRPGKGYWVRSNAKILQLFLKEGKFFSGKIFKKKN